MMIGSVILQYPSTIFIESSTTSIDKIRSRSVARSRGIICTAQRSSTSIPKLEPFSRNKIDRMIKEPPFLQKCESDLTEYCSTLEGDESYSCWRAYFELKDLEILVGELQKITEEVQHEYITGSKLRGMMVEERQAAADEFFRELWDKYDTSKH